MYDIKGEKDEERPNKQAQSLGLLNCKLNCSAYKDWSCYNSEKKELGKTESFVGLITMALLSILFSLAA